MSSLQIAVLVKLPVFVISLVYGRFLSRPYRLILLQVGIALVAETAGRYIALQLHQHNVWLFNIYWLIDFAILGTAGYMLTANKTQKRIIPIAMGIAMLVWAATIYRQGIWLQPTWASSLMNIILVYIYMGVMSVTLFGSGKVWLQPGLWLSISVILFSACTIPFYSIYNYLAANDPVLLGKLFNIVLLLNFIRYPLVALSFYLYGRQKLVSLKKAGHVF